MNIPDWLPSLMGPGGVIIILIIIGRYGFKFFTELLEKQEKRYERQDKRFDEILEYINKQTLATSLNTEALKTITDRVQLFLDR